MASLLKKPAPLQKLGAMEIGNAIVRFYQDCRTSVGGAEWTGMGQPLGVLPGCVAVAFGDMQRIW